MILELHFADCFKILPTIPNGFIDLVLCDLPYGLTNCKWDSPIDLDLMWEHLKIISHEKTAFVFFGAQPFTSRLVSSNYQWFRQELIWAKNKASGHLNAKRRHMQNHENVILFSQKQTTYNPQMRTVQKPSSASTMRNGSKLYRSQTKTKYEGGTLQRYPHTALNFPVINNDGTGEKRFHPTQKPIALVDYLVKTYSNPGDTVLDFCMGSGTTGVSAVSLERNFIGIEKNEVFFLIAQERIQEG